MLLASLSVVVLDEVAGSRLQRQMLDRHYVRLATLMVQVAARISRMLLEDLESAVVDGKQRVVLAPAEVGQNQQALC